MSRFLAAIGLGERKAEADVSYDPALERNVSGGEPGHGGSDLDGNEDPGDPPPLGV